MTDEESHDTSYSTSVDSIGEAQSTQEAAQEEVDIKKTKLYHTLTPWKKISHAIREFPLVYFACFLLSVVLIALAYVGQHFRVAASIPLYENDDLVQMSVLKIVATVGWFFLGYTVLDCFLYYISSYLLDKVDFLTLSMFHINSVSTLLSSLVFTFIALILLKVWEVDYKIKTMSSITLSQIVTMCLLAQLLIITKDILVKRVRMGFNHTNYLTRIQRCLLEHQFVKTLEVVKRRIKGQQGGKIKRYLLFSHPAQERHSDEDSPDDSPATGGQESTEKYFKPKTLVLPPGAGVGTKQKMIIFKEFEKIMNKKIYHMEKTLGFSQDLKQYAQKKADSISQWLQVDKKRFQIKHLKRYVDSEYVDTITRILGMQETQPLTEKEISSLIEKTRREKYSVKKSLVQMDKALIRVSRFITISIVLFATTILLSSAIATNDVIKGVTGTFFGLGFIFQTSVKNAIDSVIFLFIVHPYDIGDRIRVEIEKEELNMVVSELNVFSTVFYQWDGAKIYIPNHVLLQKCILNVRRSGLMAENIHFQISFDTPPEKIQHLKAEVSKFIKKHPKDFAPYFMFNYHAIEDTNKLHLKIYLQHAMNWQNYEGYLQRKAKFIMFLKAAISEQKIEYYLPIQRVELVAKQAAPIHPTGSAPIESSAVAAPSA
ncbi:hypothetical protein NEDG_00454 [Nematocida displodere]|uniref:Mechanosensitive ion channel MscS domain-containing protein n=1 Tax=Nematocida displodere TaxID=1805483 RepID=A0A177ELX1_9MICR|nr:hypothetical protein NEDG_00454 [Nematocida displodere]